jgi:hypothetical protein
MYSFAAPPIKLKLVEQIAIELLVACPSSKGVLENELTNLLVGLMQV